jgi:endo-1,4-beta-xylanase
MKYKHVLAILIAVLLIAVVAQLSTAQNYYQAWTAGGGTMNAQNLGNGHYRVSWSGVNDIVVGSGWNPCNNQNIQWTGSASGAQYFGVYGWLSSPLVEYYIGRGGGSSQGSYSTSKGSYTLNQVSCNGANINGNGPFTQYNCSGSGSSPINMAEHFQGWRNLGKSVNSQNYCIVATEAWGGSSGSADVTVSSAGSSSGGSSGGSSSGGSSSGGSYQVSIRMRGTSGSEHVVCRVGSTQIGSWTLGTGFNTYQASTTASGGITVCFDNDASGRDVQVDCIWTPAGQFQAESQSYNSGVYQNGKCGGSYSEWLHCNGCIGFSAYRKAAGDEATSEQIVPNTFALEQNYPNPFNPSTTIPFVLPENSFVSLKVYNYLGQEVADLAGKEYSAGRHFVTFNAAGLASGIYYYAIKAGSFTMVQKMVLQK